MYGFLFLAAISTARAMLQTSHEKEVEHLETERRTLQRNLSSSSTRLKTLAQETEEREQQV